MKQKTHITLVGGQAMPVYNTIKALNPDKVIYVYSPDTSEVLDRILSEIDLPYEKENVSPTDIMEISRKANSLINTYKDDELSINLSGGTKHWSVLFSNVAEKHEDIKQYIIDQNNMLSELNTLSIRKVEAADLITQLRLNGGIADNAKSFSSYTENDKFVCSKIIDCRDFSHNEFRELLSVISKEVEHNICCN